jgi:hypothetical protein
MRVVIQAVVILRAGMEEMKVMVVGVKMLVMTGELPSWNTTLGSKRTMNTVTSVCHKHLQIVRVASF